MNKQPLIILSGPTAAGKTQLSIALAKAIGGEIISADSVQVYRHMDIGSAKINEEEMQGVRHYLIDVLDPDEAFDVTVFQQMAKSAMEEIYGRGHIPILVGGTGFYIQALVKDIHFEEEEQDASYRQALEEEAKNEGTGRMYKMLCELDPISAQTIHPNNVKRVIRALEFYHKNGFAISAHNAQEKQRQSPYDVRYFVLTTDRSKLYERIDKRVDEMIEQGLEEEVKGLLAAGYAKTLTSMQSLGYAQMASYLQGEITFEEAVYLIKRDTRHFAKRQLTWFRREEDVIWIDKDQYQSEDEILEYMLEEIRKHD